MDSSLSYRLLTLLLCTVPAVISAPADSSRRGRSGADSEERGIIFPEQYDEVADGRLLLYTDYTQAAEVGGPKRRIDKDVDDNDVNGSDVEVVLTLANKRTSARIVNIPQDGSFTDQLDNQLGQSATTSGQLDQSTLVPHQHELSLRDILGPEQDQLEPKLGSFSTATTGDAPGEVEDAATTPAAETSSTAAETTAVLLETTTAATETTTVTSETTTAIVIPTSARTFSSNAISPPAGQLAAVPRDVEAIIFPSRTVSCSTEVRRGWTCCTLEVGQTYDTKVQ